MNEQGGINNKRITNTIKGLEELKKKPDIYLPLIQHYEHRLSDAIGTLLNVLDQADEYIMKTNKEMRERITV